MATKFAEKAFHLIQPFVCHKQKDYTPNESTKYIHSFGTERQYIQSVTRLLEWMDDLGLDIDGPYTTTVKQEFLYCMEEVFEQTQLDTTRQALELVFGEKLIRTKSLRATHLTTRSYTSEEVLAIVRHQSDWNVLPTMLSFMSGLRAHEAFTLKRKSEAAASPGRPWSPELFSGLEDHEIYIVKGKGGLIRQVAIPHKLAECIEARRSKSPWLAVDRGIEYESMYAIGGGQSFSQSFCSASKKALGFSHGAHGLRHSYAKQRLDQLRTTCQFSLEKSMLILSQELGHFRPEITMIYLR